MLFFALLGNLTMLDWGWQWEEVRQSWRLTFSVTAWAVLFLFAKDQRELMFFNVPNALVE